MNDLRKTNPGLARHFLWATNSLPAVSNPLWLHVGCGVNVLSGFLNLDAAPQDPRVVQWDLLGIWPKELAERAEGLFSEDCFEHFFYSEQVYILCNINRAMKTDGVARLLMPSMHRAATDYLSFYRDNPQEFLHPTYGVGTGCDITQYGMRFTGHRWFHDDQSIRHMGAICGFDALATNCSTSSLAKFSGLNLRNESNSASFATDLRKRRPLDQITLSPITVKGATKVEEIGPDAALYMSVSPRPTVEYRLPAPVGSNTIACINFRSSSLSCFDFGQKTLIFDNINAASPWHFDETLKCQPAGNIITNGQIKTVIGAGTAISRMTFSPVMNTGEYFTLGCAEVFTLRSV